VPGQASSFARQCPQCGRIVPKQVHECRCGHSLTPESLEPVAAGGAQSSALPRGLGWVVAAALALSLIAVLTHTTGRGTKSADPQPPSSTAASAPPAVEPAPRPAIASPPEPAPAAALTTIVAGPELGAPPPLEDVIGRAVPAVVSLRAGATNGSGFFVTDDTLVTNEHVVSAHPSVSIRLHDGTQITGYVAARHPSMDLALVRVAGRFVAPARLSLGRSAGIRVGQEVFAIGSPLGNEGTVTRGIISAVRTVEGMTLLQTDAAINPGNSGGPLLDRHGYVVGVTTLKLNRAEQLGFAIGIDHALPIIEGRGTPASPSLALALTERGIVAAPKEEQKSQLQIMQEHADRRFRPALQHAGRLTTRLIAEFNNYAAACAGKTTASSWLQAFQVPSSGPVSTHSGSMQTGNEATAACRIAWTDLVAAAKGIRTIVADVEEQARQAGVFPGVMRDLLHEHGLEEVAAIVTR